MNTLIEPSRKFLRLGSKPFPPGDYTTVRGQLIFRCSADVWGVWDPFDGWDYFTSAVWNRTFTCPPPTFLYVRGWGIRKWLCKREHTLAEAHEITFEMLNKALYDLNDPRRPVQVVPMVPGNRAVEREPVVAEEPEAVSAGYHGMPVGAYQ